MIIYKITNDIDDKVYIGRTVRRLSTRWREHLNSANAGDSRHIYCAMRKYGLEHFTITEVCKCDSLEDLYEKEAYYVNYFDAYNSGYNMTEGGEINPMECSQAKKSHDDKMKSEIIKTKISQTMKLVRQNTSHYITINNEKEQKRVPPKMLDAFLANGWVNGTLKNKKYMYKGTLQKLIPQCFVNKYLEDGWQIGKLDKKTGLVITSKQYAVIKKSRPKRIKEAPKPKGFNKSQIFRDAQRERLLEYYKNNPNRKSKSKQKLIVYNNDISYEFDSCVQAAKSLNLPEYIASSGIFKEWERLGYINKKSSPYHKWKIRYLKKEGDNL